jgi:hypothetical protein
MTGDLRYSGVVDDSFTNNGGHVFQTYSQLFVAR